MIENVKKIVDFIRADPLTSACAIALALSSLIIGQPGLVAFAGPSSALVIVQFAEFVQKASAVIGLLFSAQTRLPKAETPEEKKEDSTAPVQPSKRIRF